MVSGCLRFKLRNQNMISPAKLAVNLQGTHGNPLGALAPGPPTGMVPRKQRHDQDLWVSIALISVWMGVPEISQGIGFMEFF